MSSSLPKLAILSASLLLTTGCSDLMKQDDIAKSSPTVNKTDPYDRHYGMPSARGDNGGYATKPKYKKVRVPVKSNAPARYKVKKGDTLWDISNKFLKDPRFWPEIWDKNQRIKNPHLIYPGDLLYIYQTRRNVNQGGRMVEVLIPQIRVEREDGTGKPISAIAPFLSWPRVLDKESIERAPYIVDGRDNHLIIGNDHTVYIKKLRDPTEGKVYPVFNKSKPLYDSDTNELLGYEVIYKADAQIMQGRGEVTSAKIMNSRAEVHIGDRLLKGIDEKVVLNVPMVAPVHKVRASVLSLYEASLLSGRGMIVVLDAGMTEGIKPGHILGVYASGRLANDPYETRKKVLHKHLKDIKLLDAQVPVKVGLPPERVATAVVYKVSKKLSYALITKSAHEVKKGYKIGNP